MAKVIRIVNLRDYVLGASVSSGEEDGACVQYAFAEMAEPTEEDTRQYLNDLSGL